MGSKESLEQLTLRLKARPADEEWQFGPIHGDLHADNVQVRGTDAILIDFLCAKWGLLLADPAALEVSIVFRVPAAVHRFDEAAWSRAVSDLYQQPYLRGIPTVSDPREPYAWMGDCVRQIRLHAFARERIPGQYAAVLAYRLLYASGKTDSAESSSEELRRATAFWIAERLLTMSWT
jgi:hypothetical protein